MGVVELITAGGAIVGQLSHIIKKRSEGKDRQITEAQFLKQWVTQKPATTLISIVGSMAAAFMLQVEGGEMWQTFMSAFSAGIAGNSFLNRQGQKK